MKKNLKKCVALLLIMALLSVTGCGGQVGRRTTRETPEESPVALLGSDGGTPDENSSDTDLTWLTWEDCKGIYHEFCRESMYRMLSEKWGDNPQDAAVIYSPVNLYLCLAMLSELSDGETREQMKELLGGFSVCADVSSSTSEEELWKIVRKEEQKLIRHCSSQLYQNTFSEKCSLGNSLWLNERISFQDKTLDTVSEKYHALCESGEMGSTDFDKEIQRWLNEQTGGKLADLISGDIRTSVNIVLLMLSAINFEDQWDIRFDKALTTEEIFYGQQRYTCGNTTEEEKIDEETCDFLHTTILTEGVDTKQYQAVSLPMSQNRLCIVLPKEEAFVDRILKNKKGEDLLALCDRTNKKWNYTKVHFSMPKLDFNSVLDLKPLLQELGVKDVFDSDKADFSYLAKQQDKDYNNPVYLSQAHQTSKMTVDENGCSVASYTKMVLEEKSAVCTADTMQMHCDHPFLFMITNTEDLPLFIGVVNRIEN